MDVPDHLGVYVGWRSGHFIFIALTALVAYGFDACWRRGTAGKAAILALAVAVGLVAAPTVLFDLYNTQDVWNRNRGAGFRLTVLLSPTELEASSGSSSSRPPTRSCRSNPPFAAAIRGPTCPRLPSGGCQRACRSA